MLTGEIAQFAGQFENCDTYGSLIDVQEIQGLDEAIDEFHRVIGFNAQQLERMMQLYKILSQRYDVVCTNPPYMGGSGMNSTLSGYVKKNYADSKSDLFACFIEKGLALTKKNGFSSMVTMQSWMFLSSFENLRVKLLNADNITNLMHMENMVMGIAFGTAVSIFRNSHIRGYKGTYNHIKLSNLIKDEHDNDIPVSFPVMENRFAQVSTENFSKIPGMPVAYWVSENFVRAFENKKLGEIAFPKTGFTTGNNDSFLRLWFEVGSKQINKKWFYLNKGGSFRKWYGNDEYVVDWENDGNRIKKAKGSTIRNREFYFKEGVTWSKITSYKLSGRYSSDTHIFDAVGLTCFPSDKIDLMYILAVFNNKVSCEMMFILNPTLSYTTGAIASLPIAPEPKELKTEIESFVRENVELSKRDWDSFETSWDFERHPLV